ncbi:MAG: class IV lanthionine synthetase LanL [Labedaea sp.]
MAHHPEFPLVGIARSAMDGIAGWTLAEGPFWCHATPAGIPPRVQGWKVHLSATVLSAPLVLHQTAGILVSELCPFKFVGSLRDVAVITGPRFDRAQAGKFLVAYPRHDDQLDELVDRLDAATLGLPGPRILSDRVCRRGSLVHLRYGAFDGVPVLSNDGRYERRIRDPHGHLVADPRTPWFTPPDWVALPSMLAAPIDRPAGPPLLNNRFQVTRAIRHSARGGVYEAVDRSTGHNVIVKQARAHIGTGMSGEDCRAALRTEHRRLSELDGLTADPIDLFEQEDSMFLVESVVPGRSLAEWVRDRFADLGEEQGPTGADAFRLAGRLAALLGEVHRRGLVYRDFTSVNIMIGSEGELRLIDPESAARPGDVVISTYTEGFAAPEVMRSGPYCRAPGPESDLYALGAVIFHILTGAPPLLPPEDPGVRSNRGRIAALLDLTTAHSEAARLLKPLVLGLTADQPAERWPLARVEAFLTRGGARTPVADTPGSMDRRHREPDTDRLIDDGLAHLVATMDVDGDWLWPVGSATARLDACAGQYGAAGVLAVLTRASEVFHRADLRAAVATTASWIDARLDRIPRLLPGLHFGRAGTAWALYDAARHLGDDALAERALGLALRLDTRWPNPDVCHGAAGAGLVLLRMWYLSRRSELLDAAIDCADGLLAVAAWVDDGVFWPVPEDFDSALAGGWHYGFAHGVAGVGAFLLAAAQASGRTDYADTAVAAGDTLVRAAERGVAGGARWRCDRNRPPSPAEPLYHWCHGSSGVGTFLVRLDEHLGGGTGYRTLAEAAAVAVHRTRGFSSPAACHGLAGNGEFLLDLSQRSSAPSAARYREWANDLADWICVRHAVLDGRRVTADETQTGVSPGFGTGLAGALGFLLRLRHHGPRQWMPDDPAVPSLDSRITPSPGRADLREQGSPVEADRTTRTEPPLAHTDYGTRSR